MNELTQLLLVLVLIAVGLGLGVILHDYLVYRDLQRRLRKEKVL